jgi:Tol biopolymer transport system component/predicted Ser/Thr protein kinase
MAVNLGDRLGPYEILAPIGAGGMGEVFKARDTRLGRTVAIKVASGKFSERFDREARAVASLSHPNICTLYDVGPDYLVMEYIDGKPLKGPLPTEMVLRYAREIASALDAAHRLNIIHRDLKPANILVAKGGIKLLDFGLAKMNATEPASEETVTKALTQEGTILGTLQYMSPEQLEGKEADARSDIFSFGCVLYEMITGRMAFAGESKASIIAAIMEREPQPMAGVPAALERAIYRAMAKDPDERWQSARDVAGVLELAAMTPETASQKVRTRKLPLAVLAIVALLALAAAIWFALHRPVEVAWSGEPLGGPAAAFGPRVSPDGHTLAFQVMVDGQTQVGILKPETGNWTVLTHQKDLGQVLDLAWSRDGSKIYFDRQTDSPAGIYSVPLLGGEPRMVLELAGCPQVLADGSLIVARINAQRDLQLHRFWPDSGKLEALPALLDNSGATVTERITADGRQVVYYGYRSDAPAGRRERGVFALDPSTGKMRQLAPGVVFRAGQAVAVATSQDPRFVILGVPAGSLYRLIEVPIDGGAATRTLLTLTTYPWYLDTAPDGSIYADQISTTETLLRFPVAGGTPERLTPLYTQPLNMFGVLRDGRPLIYTNSGTKFRFVIVEPGGGLSPLVESDERCGPPVALLGDRQVAVMTDRKAELAIVSIADGRITSRVALQHDHPSTLTASPDGKMLYYTAGGFVWSMAATGGKAEKLGSGDGVSADPNGRDLIVSLAEKEATRLVRMPITGGAVQPIEMHGGLRLAGPNISTRAVASDGKIAVFVSSPSQWPYLSAIVDPRAQTIAAVPLNFEGEISYPSWAPDGRLVASAKIYRYTIWQFHAKPR